MTNIQYIAPLSHGKAKGIHRRIAYRAPKIDVNDSDDQDPGFNDDGKEEAAQDSVRDETHETHETSSAEEDCGDVPANVLKAEVKKHLR
jgi:hypothetical protein